MADNFNIPAGTGAVLRARDVGNDVKELIVSINGSTSSSSALVAGEAHIGAVGGNTVEVNVTPTLTTHANYVSGDYVGTDATPMTFAACARVVGGTGTVIGAVLVDYATQGIAGELWLFDTLVTPPADSAAWTISDAHAARCVGVIPFSTYYASVLNAVSPASNLSIPFKALAGATALYGCFVTRGAPTYASGDLTFRLFIAQD